MTPGPDQVVACPHCSGLARYHTINSGNTFGARIWTDGKRIAPMLPEPPRVVKCHDCRNCYWLADARKVGEVGGWRPEAGATSPAWLAEPVVEEPAEEDYYRLLESGSPVAAKRLRVLRTLAWWRRNDTFRDAAPDDRPASAIASGPCRSNLEALVDLLQQDNGDTALMRAEALRELGDFAGAAQALSTVSQAKAGWVVQRIAGLCEAGDTCVRELRMERQ